MRWELLTEFQDIFGESPDFYSFAPGRVNLIGEHTDYTGGYVFPVALDIGTYALGRKRQDGKFRFYSLNRKDCGILEVDGDWTYRKSHDWANYPKGVVVTLKNHGHPINEGMDLLYYGNLPRGAGLSSSASIELATGVLLDEAYGLRIDRISLAMLCREAENSYVGVNCGIMDQFVIAMGEEHRGLLLNTGDLSFRQVPLPLEDHHILILHSMIRRSLSDSGYNRCIEDAKTGEGILKKRGVSTLRDLSPEDLVFAESVIDDPEIFRRIRHIITENQRTLEGEKRLWAGDLKGFGRLMVKSHESLKQDFKVSIPQLDSLVEEAINLGALGARMTGAGFGGCIVAIVPRKGVDIFRREIIQRYETAHGLTPEIYRVNSSDGAHCESIEREVKI